jgi:hypothetical protein
VWVLPEAGDGTNRAVAAMSGGGLRRQKGGSSGGRQSVVAGSGRASRKEVRQWVSTGAARGAALEQGVASGVAARRPAVALRRGRGKAEKEKEGGRQGPNFPLF